MGEVKEEPTYSWPGPGGSLGKCAVCGESFLKEVLMGEMVARMGLDGFKNDFPAHIACREKVMKIKDWHDLPAGPIRTVFAENAAKKESGEAR